MGLGVGLEALEGAEAVGDEGEGPLGGLGGVLLAQGPGGGVAGVGERGLPGGGLGLVEAREVGAGEVDLAADFEEVGDGEAVCGGEALGDGGDGADVRGDVFAGDAVAAGGGAGEAAVLVDEVDGEAVDLDLAEVALAGDLGGDAVGPGLDFFEAEDVLEAEHLLQVDDGRERLGEGADDLGRRVGGLELGEGRLQVDEFVHELVELAVGDDRLLGVVPAPVLGDLVGERLVPGAGALEVLVRVSRAHGPIVSAGSDVSRRSKPYASGHFPFTC
nr:hypothetical protein GCM10025732_49820 [Glycomyces mayteni]